MAKEGRRIVFVRKEDVVCFPTYVISHKVNLWQCEGIIQGHEDCRLDSDVYQIQASIAKKIC